MPKNVVWSISVEEEHLNGDINHRTLCINESSLRAHRADRRADSVFRDKIAMGMDFKPGRLAVITELTDGKALEWGIADLVLAAFNLGRKFERMSPNIEINSCC